MRLEGECGRILSNGGFIPDEIERVVLERDGVVLAVIGAGRFGPTGVVFGRDWVDIDVFGVVTSKEVLGSEIEGERSRNEGFLPSFISVFLF